MEYAIWISITYKRKIGIVVEYKINRNCLSLTRPQSIVKKLAINKCATYSDSNGKAPFHGQSLLGREPCEAFSIYHLPLMSFLLAILHFLSIIWFIPFTLPRNFCSTEKQRAGEVVQWCSHWGHHPPTLKAERKANKSSQANQTLAKPGQAKTSRAEQSI